MKRKILAVLDGSDQAMDEVKYISHLFPPQKTEVVLFNVKVDLPEPFLDLSREPGFGSSVASASAWSYQVKNNMDKFMDDAKKFLTDSGFSPELVKTRIQSKKVGIARDILNESEKGYSLVVAGRTGASGIKDVIMGSIAAKLIAKVPGIPISTVGGNPESKKVLIGFDGSDGAMKAVSCIGRLLGNTDCEVTLCHVIRPMGIHYGLTKYFSSKEEAKWIEENKKLIEPAFNKAEQRLKNAGFSPDQISRDILKKKTSRAAALVAKAKKEGYGTLVVGRRGITAVEEFLMGRVSTKVLNMVTQAAVLVV